jgi:hypothetical protein
MPRQRSPSRLSCRLAVKQQTLGAGWSAYRSNDSDLTWHAVPRGIWGGREAGAADGSLGRKGAWGERESHQAGTDGSLGRTESVFWWKFRRGKWRDFAVASHL